MASQVELPVDSPIETPVDPSPPAQEPDYTVNSEDLIPPDLMAKLKEAASAGLDGHQMLSLAALAFTNPNKAWELVRSHEDKKGKAEDALLDLGVRAKGMEVQLKKQAMVQGQADKKARQAADTADKKDAAAQERANLVAATQLIARDKTRGVQVSGEKAANLMASVKDPDKFAAAVGEYEIEAGRGQRKVNLMSGLKAGADDVARGTDPKVVIGYSGITEEDMADPQIRAAIDGLNNMANRYQQERAAIEWRKNQAIDIQAFRARSAAETAAARNRAATAVNSTDITRELSVQNAIRNDARKAYEIASREFLAHSNNGDEAGAADAQSRMADATSEMAASTEMIRDLEERQRSITKTPKKGRPVSEVLSTATQTALVAASRATQIDPKTLADMVFSATLSENPKASRAFFDSLYFTLVKETGRNPRDIDFEIRSGLHRLAAQYYRNLPVAGQKSGYLDNLPGNIDTVLATPDANFGPGPQDETILNPPEEALEGPQQ